MVKEFVKENMKTIAIATGTFVGGSITGALMHKLVKNKANKKIAEENEEKYQKLAAIKEQQKKKEEELKNEEERIKSLENIANSNIKNNEISKQLNNIHKDIEKLKTKKNTI